MAAGGRGGVCNVQCVCKVCVCLTWRMDTRQQGQKQEKRSGCQLAGRPGGGGCWLKRYHPIAHLFLQWPATVFDGLTCAGHIKRTQAGREGEREEGRITINSTGYVMKATHGGTRVQSRTELWKRRWGAGCESENCRLWIIANAWMNQRIAERLHVHPWEVENP